MADNGHICGCGDCEVAPYVDRCKYEARCAELEAEVERLRSSRTGGDVTLQEAARLRREGEEARRRGVDALMAAVQANRGLGATEISRQLTAAGWSITRGQVHRLMNGRTR